MPKTKVEVYDKDQLIYPYIESDHVTFSNGMKVSEMLDQSISMPTVVHEDLSFKVGVGDQDVSSAIVDSSVSEMTIKGKTYQNILPEPSTHVLTNNKEMFKVNEGLDPNVEIVDAVSESAILKGQTLVNLVANPTHTFTQTSTINETWKQVNKYFTVDLQVGKTYIALWDMTWTNAAYAPTPTAFCFRNKDNQGVGRYSQLPSGKYYCKVTIDGSVPTPTMFRFHTSLDPGIENTLTVSNFIVLEYQEGMEEWNIPYFEGMTSVKMPVLTTIGKNLFDGKFKFGEIAGGVENNDTKYVKSINYISVKPNTNYFLSCTDGYNSTGGRVIAWYDSNRNFISHVNNKGVSPSKACFARIRTRRDDSAAMTGNEISTIQAQFEESSSATPYEPYKTNILHTPEEVILRSLPNGVCDTLNLTTGEYVKRIGEVVLNGSETWNNAPSYINGSPRFCYDCSDIKVRNNVGNQLVLTNSDTIISVPSDIPKSATKGVFHHNVSAQIHIFIPSSEIGGTTPSNFKTYLQQNPITVQYELATPIIKTINLSSSGNWEKIVLNGSENWGVYQRNNSVNFTKTSSFQAEILNANFSIDSLALFTDGDFNPYSFYSSDREGAFIKVNKIRLAINKNKLTTDNVEGFKQYLRQNPVTLWYQTDSPLNSTQVKQPIFFKDGHIQLSSGADNSLIPTLDYQAKTSNSYVMDLMKANTRYTMKAKSASGTFTIDGTSYGAGTNGTFTTPTSMTNKFLVMSNKTNEEVMILEGDVVSKSIPYFKGIKSAFEDESKIEVLSTGKNLFDLTLTQGRNTYEKVGEKPNIANSDTRVTNQLNNYIEITPNTKITFSILNNIDYAIGQLDGNGNSLGDTGWVGYQSAMPNYTLTTKPNAKYIGFNFRKTDNSAIKVEEVLNSNPMLEIGSSPTTYEPHKSNNTKIPLLSPLRSLPDGTCDELVIDRESNKVKIIQRVGELDFSNLQYNTWIVSDSTLSKTVRFTWLSSNMSFYKVKASSDGICDSIPYMRHNSSDTEHCRFDGSNPSAFMIWADKSKLTSFDDKGLKKYLSTLPSTRVQYELATPIITEVDLEGFPYIYKDGHIFLNGEIVPVTEITYSINQCQQISASNEDIIRHEKELTYLQKLIAQYVQVDYESALLSLKV